jgi:hypothetical protein
MEIGDTGIERVETLVHWSEDRGDAGKEGSRVGRSGNGRCMSGKDVGEACRQHVGNRLGRQGRGGSRGQGREVGRHAAVAIFRLREAEGKGVAFAGEVLGLFPQSGTLGLEGCMKAGLLGFPCDAGASLVLGDGGEFREGFGGGNPGFDGGFLIGCHMAEDPGSGKAEEVKEHGEGEQKAGDLDSSPQDGQ